MNALEREFLKTSQQAQRRRQTAFGSAALILIAALAFAALIFSRQASQNAELARNNAEIAETAQAASTLAVAQQATAESERIRAEQNAHLADINASTAQAASTWAIVQQATAEAEANVRATAQMVAAQQRDEALH